MTKQKTTIHFNSHGRSGNIFHIMVMVRNEMQAQSRITEWNNTYEKIGQAGSYEEALMILRELVDLVDDDGRY